jgi:hypothetical protein
MSFHELQQAAPLRWWHVFTVNKKTATVSDEVRYPGLLRQLSQEQLERAFSHECEVASGDQNLPKVSTNSAQAA